MTRDQRFRIETIAGKYFPDYPKWVDSVPNCFSYLAETDFSLDNDEELAETIEIIRERIVAVLPDSVTCRELDKHVDIVLRAIEERL